ncbi:transporter [Sporolactobacillus pectinivorans]|uniref:YkvI family membrane protein n=1 Tax=Sporolactobacillus pectinivorans TaxID=1591408 RepID=UPI000C25A8AB|nr:transporter [Sporolactobacillus pectinivorans]
MVKKIIDSLQIAAAFIGTVVGAGFASGREIIQFFSQYQAWGMIGAAISGLLMAWIGTKMMVYARRIKAYSFNELVTRLFGEHLGAMIQCLIFLMMLGITGVMLAGAGAVFKEQLGWHRLLGMALSIVICLLFLVKGSRGLLWMNSIVVPVLIMLFLILFFTDKPGSVSTSNPQSAYWIASAVSYASFNIMTAIVVLVPLARDIDDERVLKVGGLAGGVGFTLLLLLSNLMILNHPSVMLFDMPMAELVRPLGLIMHLIFVIVIFGEILTTFVGNIFGLARQMHSAFPHFLSPERSIILLIFSSLILGQASYGSLIRVLYPLYGFICTALFVYLFFARLPQK